MGWAQHADAAVRQV